MRSNSDVDRTILIERGTRGRAHAGRVRALVAHPSRKDANGFSRKVVAHGNPSLRVAKFTTVPTGEVTMPKTVVSYIRVSTARQGHSGLGFHPCQRGRLQLAEGVARVGERGR